MRLPSGPAALGALAPLLDSTIALVMVVPVGGWAAERYGGRQVWLAALALFLAGSLLCALAWDIESLIVFLVVQGVGGELMCRCCRHSSSAPPAGRSWGG
ncbi:hypothetical protein ACFZDK_05530 [Streptomyces sp. NPDC007901]|uniref:hypothetical protein n=1 Tax=Streptomyces sp. NPDC007901 TaxID=3364785 RepID=UPI0036E6C3E7